MIIYAVVVKESSRYIDTVWLSKSLANDRLVRLVDHMQLNGYLVNKTGGTFSVGVHQLHVEDAALASDTAGPSSGEITQETEIDQ